MNPEINFLFAIIAAFSLSLVTLVGFVYCFITAGAFSKLLPWILSLTVGVLLGNVFFHLVPEAIHEASQPDLVWIWLILGILVFFGLNALLNRRHHGGIESPAIKPIGFLNLLGDSLHNFIDGLVIGASFMIHFEVGLATTLAILVHELPQELGDSGTLIYSGFKPKKVVKLNFLVSLTALPGVLVVFGMKHWIMIDPAILVAFTAGGFLYMAVGNLIPELWRFHACSKRIKVSYLAAAVVGMAFVFGVTQSQPHVHKQHGQHRFESPLQEQTALPFGFMLNP